MSGITREIIRSSLAAFRSSHQLADDVAFDDLILESLYMLTHPDNDNPKRDEITSILKNYFQNAPKKNQRRASHNAMLIDTEAAIPLIQTDEEVDDQQFNRFFKRIFKRLLLKQSQFKSSHSQTLLKTIASYNLHFIMPGEFRQGSPDLNTQDSEEADSQTDSVALLVEDNPPKELKTLHHQYFFTEVSEALAEEVYNNDIKADGYYIGYRHKVKHDDHLKKNTAYQAYNLRSRLADISEDKVISPSPPPPSVSPVNVIVNINSGLDNAISTAADRVVKVFKMLAAQAGGVLQHGDLLHGIFSWIGFGVSFIYTLGFAAGFLYRRFYLKEKVDFGPREAGRMLLSVAFLSLCIASMFAAGPAAIFILGFPIIAAGSGFFTLGEHLYDCLHKNKEELQQLPEKKQDIKIKIKLSKQHLADLELTLLTERSKDVPDIKIVKNLQAKIADTHIKYTGEKNELIKLLETERSLTEQQIRLKDPLSIFITGLRTFNVILTVVGAGLFFANPILGLSIVAFCGVLGFIVFGLAVYNKHRLDKKIEGTLDMKPAVGELSETIFNPKSPPKPDNTDALVSGVLRSQPDVRVEREASNEINQPGANRIQRSDGPQIRPASSHTDLENLADLARTSQFSLK